MKRKLQKENAADKEPPKYAGPRPTSRVLGAEEIKGRFDKETALVYKQQDPVFLPDYAATFDLLVDCVMADRNTKMTVLDLGAGTGNLSLRMLRGNKNCYMTLVDFSQDMLNAVPDVLAEFKNRFKVICDDFNNVVFNDAPFDAIISSFALHHTRGEKAYTVLYGKIHRWLKPGGMFACVDVVSGANPSWTELNENGWRNYLLGRLDADEVAHIFSNYRSEDSPISLPEHLSSLQKAGFTQADILWKRHNFALYCARK
ncbi:MAG: class I SAM-dependent methyltransferase [Chitinivibrionales bacterium]